MREFAPTKSNNPKASDHILRPVPKKEQTTPGKHNPTPSHFSQDFSAVKVGNPGPLPIIQAKLAARPPKDKREDEAGREARELAGWTESSGQYRPPQPARKSLSLQTSPLAPSAAQAMAQRGSLRPARVATVQTDATSAILQTRSGGRALVDSAPMGQAFGIKAGSDFERQSSSGRGGRKPLPTDIQPALAQKLGVDVSKVTINTNSSKPAKVGAFAYTQGDTIEVAPGQNKPSIIQHELGHVVQQAQGRVKPTGSVGRVPLNDDPKLEREADIIGKTVKQKSIINNQDLSPYPQTSETSQDSLTPRPSGLIQRELISWRNPVLDADSIPTPTEGANEVLNAARTIDLGTEAGRKDVMDWIKAYQQGSTTSDKVKDYFTGKATDGHVSNFVNKLIDWGKSGSGKTLGLLKATAGYIIEDYADAKASDVGAKSQVALGGARPDFELVTGKTWMCKGGTRNADGFIDATSKSEALKGHISEKITRMGEDDALKHPHLYDTYYEDLDVTGAKPNVSLLEEASTVYQEREKEMKRRIKMARARQASLRSTKKKPHSSPY